MESLLLDREAVTAGADMPAVIAAVAAAFEAYASGDVQMPAKSYIDLPQYDGDFRSMPAYVEAEDWEAAGHKWVNSHPQNPATHELPTVMGTMVYSDPETAVPLALLDGTSLTRLRTGAAAAVATDHLAVDDASTVGIIGAGVQSYAITEAIATVRQIEDIVVVDADPDATAAYIRRFENTFDVREGTVGEAGSCDVLCTITPVEDPIVSFEAVGERTHINAMGADAPGKNELAHRILLAATVVVDDPEQSIHSGELNVPYATGAVTDDDIHATLGAVVAGHRPGRTSTDGITVFDSTGLAIQDVAAAHVVYEHAREQGLGTPYELVDTGRR